MKRTAILGVLLGFFITASLGIVWNAAWEGRPDGTLLASDIDLFFQEFKDEVADRATVEQNFGIGSDDNGLMRIGSARVFAQNAAPTDIAGPGQYNSTAGAVAGTALGTDEIGTSTNDIGDGRLWVDLDGPSAATTLDDRKLFSWDDTSDTFLAVRTEIASPPPGSNLIYHGSFEITDGTGVASAAVPIGWSFDGTTPTTSYIVVSNSTEGDGTAVKLIGSGAANERIMQRLAGLKESTAYIYRARVRSIVGTCSLFVDDGTTSASATSAPASGVFETLEVLHTTTAGPADVDVELRSVADTNECDWDHVTVFERDAVVSQPGFMVVQDTSTDNATAISDAFGVVPGIADLSVTPPGPGWGIEYHGGIQARALGVADTTLRLEILETCGGGPTAKALREITMNDDSAARIVGLDVYGLTLPSDLTPGQICTYGLRAADDGVGSQMETAGTRGFHYLTVKLFPTR